MLYVVLYFLIGFICAVVDEAIEGNSKWDNDSWFGWVLCWPLWLLLTVGSVIIKRLGEKLRDFLLLD